MLLVVIAMSVGMCVFLVRKQSQVTLLSPNQSVLYTWDDPAAERTLMWNVYNRRKPSYPAFINKVSLLEYTI